MLIDVNGDSYLEMIPEISVLRYLFLVYGNVTLRPLYIFFTVHWNVYIAFFQHFRISTMRTRQMLSE